MTYAYHLEISDMVTKLSRWLAPAILHLVAKEYIQDAWHQIKT